MKNAFSHFTAKINAAVGSPMATVLAFVLVVMWAIVGPQMHYSNFWQLLMNTTSSVITFLMVFILNNAQNRDTSAINSKLDALIFVAEAADNRLIGVEHLPLNEAHTIQQEAHKLKDVVEEANGLLEGSPGDPGRS